MSERQSEDQGPLVISTTLPRNLLSSHPIYTPDCKPEKQEQRLGVNEGKKCSKATVSGELGEDGLEENKFFKYKAPFQVQSSKMAEVSRTM